ncbi:MAG: DUF4173 domain-containing protein [Oscillibacter sp.]|nr:DUF4173 domain-containing protein [Oscillibacter sp.]
MNEFENALPSGGPAKPAPKPSILAEKVPRYRLFLLLTFGWCLLVANATLWHGPSTGLTVCVFVWYGLFLAWKGRPALRSSRLLLVYNLFLALTLALGSNWYFRYWNLLALAVLVPVQIFAETAVLPWWKSAMFLERLFLYFWGLFGNLWACFAAAVPSGKKGDSRRTAAIIAGSAGALVLVAFLLPVLASADALFAAATAGLQEFIRLHFTADLGDLFWALVLTPFAFSLLYSIQNPAEKKIKEFAVPALDGVIFTLILAALDVLYLLFLAVQSAGLFGGPAYLEARNISYAEWARSGFFQMVGVTAVNLSVLLTALVFSGRSGKTWKAVRGLAAVLLAESFVLLASAAWRMTLYVTAYGLSFKRFMTYWGMVMMALFLFAAAVKLVKPDFCYCKCVFPLALAGWLAINCVPVDYLVAKNQVDRYLNHESTVVSVHYLVYSLSYDTLAQLGRLDGDAYLSQYEGGWWGRDEKLSTILDQRKASAQKQCADWRSWSLSAQLALSVGS